MPEYLTTKELAELLRLKERKVYDLAASGVLPCFRATGKLLFPRDGINAWLAESGSSFLAAGKPIPTVFLGSHDPLLEWALRESRCGIATFFDGSSDGLARFAAREGLATGLHLHDESGADWNVAPVIQACAAMPVALVEWAKRCRGLIVSDRYCKEIRTFEDLRGKRVVPRQEEAGAQNLFRHLLDRAGLAPNDLHFTAPARTEQDAALAVLEGKADAAFGLQALASQYKLPFHPIVRERFDILVDRRSWFEPPLQKFLTFCRTDAFAERADGLAGYDIANSGQVHFNGP